MFLFFFYFSKGSAAALTVGTLPVMESISTWQVSNPLIWPRQTQFYHKKSLFCNFSNFSFLDHKGVRFKINYF